jgi:putative peptidoglycan lipid II flippase
LPRTQALLARHPQGEQLAQLNRLLLEDAFSLEIADKLVENELLLRLLRVMFPYMLVICLTAVFMGMLNARGHFFIPASGALIMNSVMIASVYLLAPRLGATLKEQIFALAFGVLVAGVAQAAFQLPTLRREGFRYHWVSPWGEPTVTRVVRQMVPGAIGVAAFQLNVVMTQGVAFWVDPAINASFQYAVRLMELPQGVFGISLATYLLPTLSGLAVEKRHDEFRTTLNQGLDHIIFINLLAAMFLLVLAEPIIRLLFEHGAFTAAATRRAGFALQCLSPALLAFSLSNILARAFYALGDTKTPMKISIFCLGINMIFAVLLVQRLRQGGLGIANSVSAICNASILFYALRRRLGRLELKSIKKLILQMAVAVLVAGLVAWGLCHWWESAIGNAGKWRQLGDVFVPMIAASIVYWGLTIWMKVPPALEIGRLLLQRLRPSAG